MVKNKKLLNKKVIERWAHVRNRLNLNRRQHLAATNLFESLFRTMVRRNDLMSLTVKRQISNGWPKPPDQNEQNLIYDKNEALFQSYYNSLSKLGALVNLFPDIFANAPHRSMEKFLKYISRMFPELANDCIVIEKARSYRAFLDHPAGSQVSNWATIGGYDERGIIVIHYGAKGYSGNLPEGAHEAGTIQGLYAGVGEWQYVAPRYDEVENSLKRLIEYIFSKLNSEFLDVKSS